MAVFRWISCIAFLSTMASLAYGENKVAIAHLSSDSDITGTILFTEEEGGIRVSGTITGKEAGKYGFHVHELGDVTTCNATGGHFNPDGTNHGDREADERHVGDLGNVEFIEQENGETLATINFLDTVITLVGQNSILGRALVLHEQEDDLGLGDHVDSLTTGNAGGRVACGVIGIKSPASPWNSALTIGPSMLLLLSAVCFIFIGE